jgi:spore maturation protein CgeB
MLKVVFFNSKTFLNKELLGALKRRKDFHTLCVDIPALPAPQTAPVVFEQLLSFLPAVVISLNDAGYDPAGTLSSLISQTGSFQLNWYYDDPLYEHIYHKRALPDFSRRIDFVSERSFVPLLAEKGFNAHFLPLGTDPEYFNLLSPAPEYKYDISFVGNSSIQFIDDIVTEPIQKDLDRCKPLLVRIKQIYYNNPRENIREWLYAHADEWNNKITIDPDVFVFVMQWMVGYFYRKDFVVNLACVYPNKFMCFGDMYWSKFMAPSQVSPNAMYYKNLCSYYRSSKINININRIQTLTSFTQRIFDCKASGAFLLTDKRQLNKEFFITEGPGREFVEYSSLEDCKKLIDYFLKHDDEREEIAHAGVEKVLKNHTYDNRVDEMFGVFRKEWGI